MCTDVRKKLIKMIIEDNVGVWEACLALKVNYQTVKSIIRRYNVSGRWERKNKILQAVKPQSKEIPTIR